MAWFQQCAGAKASCRVSGACWWTVQKEPRATSSRSFHTFWLKVLSRHQAGPVQRKKSRGNAAARTVSPRYRIGTAQRFFQITLGWQPGGLAPRASGDSNLVCAVVAWTRAADLAAALPFANAAPIVVQLKSWPASGNESHCAFADQNGVAPSYEAAPYDDWVPPRFGWRMRWAPRGVAPNELLGATPF